MQITTWFSRLKREYEAHNLEAKEYLALCELGRFAGCRFGLTPSHATLAARARCHVSTVARGLQKARALGLVSWAATRVRAAWRSLQGPNRYTLTFPSDPVRRKPWFRTDCHDDGRDTYERKKEAQQVWRACGRLEPHPPIRSVQEQLRLLAIG